MFNLLTVSYATYASLYQTPGVRAICLILFIGGIIDVACQYLEASRHDRIVKREGHSEAFFEAHEERRHALLKRDLKEIF